MIGGVRTLAISSSARSRVRMVCAIAMPTLPAPITDTLLVVSVNLRRCKCDVGVEASPRRATGWKPKPSRRSGDRAIIVVYTTSRH
jgi:hypothetical protein